MFSNIDYQKTKEKWAKTHKKLSPVARENDVSPASARSWLLGQFHTKTPNEGVHAKIAQMFAKEGCLVFKKSKAAKEAA